MSEPERVTQPCDACEGCGQVADTPNREPWTAWLGLPVGSSAAVALGVVQPIPCEPCEGTGKLVEPERVNRPGDQPEFRVGGKQPGKDGPWLAAAANAYLDDGRPRGEADSEDARRGSGVQGANSGSAPQSTDDLDEQIAKAIAYVGELEADYDEPLPEGYDGLAARASSVLELVAPLLAAKDAEIERVISRCEETCAAARAEALRAHGDWREVRDERDQLEKRLKLREKVVQDVGARVAELTRERDEFVELLHYIWLYVNWRFVTKQLTTEQKELWADAVDAGSQAIDPGRPAESTADRWWRPNPCTCGHLAAAHLVLAERPGCTAEGCGCRWFSKPDPEREAETLAAWRRITESGRPVAQEAGHGTSNFQAVADYLDGQTAQCPGWRTAIRVAQEAGEPGPGTAHSAALPIDPPARRPRVWKKGDPEPVSLPYQTPFPRVADRYGVEWVADERHDGFTGWSADSHGLTWWTTWLRLALERGPLTEVLPDVLSGGDPEPRCAEDAGDRVPCNAVLDDGFCPDHGEVG